MERAPAAAGQIKTEDKLKKLAIGMAGLAMAGPAMAALAGGVQAQSDYPSKPVTWVVPFAPGGLSDSVARIIAEAMQTSLGQSVLVDNKPGGATFIGAQFLATTPADGYHIGSLDVGTLVLNQGLFNEMPYDPETDFEIVGDMAVLVSKGCMFLIRVRPRPCRI